MTLPVLHMVVRGTFTSLCIPKWRNRPARRAVRRVTTPASDRVVAEVDALPVLRTVPRWPASGQGCGSRVAGVGPSGRTVMPYTGFVGVEEKARE